MKKAPGTKHKAPKGHSLPFHELGNSMYGHKPNEAGHPYMKEHGHGRKHDHVIGVDCNA